MALHADAGAESSRPREVGYAWTTDERECLELSFIALAGCWHGDAADIALAVTALTGTMLPNEEIVWGPAARIPDKDSSRLPVRFSDALVFITRNKRSGVHSVVFRGTNTVSMHEWLLQDFRVRDLVPWAELSRGSSPTGALVSEGTATAVRLRLGLAPGPGLPGAGVPLSRALLELAGGKDARLRFTGHSLGGLLAPTMALWLIEALEADAQANSLERLELEVYAFAGPTPGNKVFADYLASRLPRLRRYANPLDIAPLAWTGPTMASLPELYEPDTRMSLFVRPLYALCEAASRVGDYAQPGPAIAIPSSVVRTRGDSYLLQASYQHAVPYLDILREERKATIIVEVIEPITRLASIGDFEPFDLERLFNPRERRLRLAPLLRREP